MTKKFSECVNDLETILQEELFTNLIGENPNEKQVYFIYEIVESLQGAYNDEGIRNWFYRERKQLEGKKPLEYLGPAWNPDDEKAKKVLELAKSLNG